MYEVCACTRLQTAASIEHVRFTYTEVSPIGFFCIAKIPKPTDCATDFCRFCRTTTLTGQASSSQPIKWKESKIWTKPKFHHSSDPIYLTNQRTRPRLIFQTLKQLKRHTKRHIQTHTSLSLSYYLNSVNRRSFYISNLSYSLLIQSLGF